MSLIGTLGSRLYVSGVSINENNASLAFFESLVINYEVGMIEDFGEFGKELEIYSYKSGNDGRTVKIIGGHNFAGMKFIIGKDVTNLGQRLIEYAFGINFRGTAAFRIEIFSPDLQRGSYNIYFGGKIFTIKTQMNGVNNLVKSVVQLELVTDVFSNISEDEFFPSYPSPDPLYPYLYDDFGNLLTDDNGVPLTRDPESGLFIVGTSILGGEDVLA